MLCVLLLTMFGKNIISRGAAEAELLSWKLFLNIVLETDSQIFTFFRKEKCSF
jgi:hypothetical protein